MSGLDQFFQSIYEGLHKDEYIELRCKGKKTTSQAFYSSIEEAAKAAFLNSKNSDVYFGIAIRDGKGGKKENLVRITCAWADLDNKDGLEPANDRLKRAILPPSVIVNSGGGLHCYWLLDEPLWNVDIARIEALNKGIALVLDGDSVHDASRIFRVPGTLNHKYESPKPVTIGKLESEQRYSLSELEEAFILKTQGIADIKVSPAEVKQHGGSYLPCRQIIWQGVPSGTRNAACFQLALDLKKQGLRQEAAQETGTDLISHR